MTSSEHAATQSQSQPWLCGAHLLLAGHTSVAGESVFVYRVAVV